MQVSSCLHDDGRNVDVGLDRLVRQDAATVDVDLVRNGHIVAENGHVLQTSPLADGAVPADDGALDPRMVLDLGARQQDAALQAHAVADGDARPDGDIGSDAAVVADLGGGVDEDVAAVDVWCICGRELLGALLGERG